MKEFPRVDPVPVQAFTCAMKAASSLCAIGCSHMQVLRLSLFSTVLLAATACVSASGGAAPASAPAVTVNAVASPVPATASSLNGATASTTPGVAPAVVDVSPAEVQAGTLRMSMSLERARHMLDQAVASTSDPDPAHQAGGSAASSTASATPTSSASSSAISASSNATSAGSTAYVLQGMLQLTNNFNPAQPIPDDQPQAMLRHVDLQIRNGTGGPAVPYLSASMDVLLDGHPVAANVPLLPMVDADAAPAQMYYGNNVKLTQRGSYQVFVRVSPNALLGKDAVPAAQFNVAVQ
jgi:hypothetical protein